MDFVPFQKQAVSEVDASHLKRIFPCVLEKRTSNQQRDWNEILLGWLMARYMIYTNNDIDATCSAAKEQTFIESRDNSARLCLQK
ncbi:unnamed protein product [Cylicocyclus nassatus]|uniref:Uncharacterized protein n=1 Tax=Cylicocyclus nassatus TaxID=53992 RepID=A0AA36HDE5_CYLNA|nr:unnamed protein product [Cylicocyclus nassatus]